MILTEMKVVVTRARMRKAEAGGYETGGSVWQGATPAVAKMAVTESGELRERRQQWQSAAVEAGGCRASLGGEGM